MRGFVIGMVWVISSVVLAAGCGGSDGDGGGSGADGGGGGGGGGDAAACTGTVSFAADVQPIFDASCTSGPCHNPQRLSGDLDLTSPDSYSQLLGVASTECDGRVRVTAGDVAQSYLFDKVSGAECAGTDPMPPPGLPQLSADQIETLRTWICTGAADD